MPVRQLAIGAVVALLAWQAPRSGNPIIEGWYADPEVRVFEQQYWIYPTYSAPYGQQVFMDAFSSTDLVTWTKHPRVLDAALSVEQGLIRLNASLLGMRGGTAVWADMLERRDTGVLAARDDLARAVVNSLRLEIGGGQRRYRTDPELELAFLRARALQVRRQPVHAEQAVALFETIVRRDPSYAPAAAGLARSLGDLWHLNRERVQGADDPRLEQAALAAIRLDPMLPDAQAALGTLYARDRRWTEAEAAFGRAIERDRSQGSLYADFVLALLLMRKRLLRFEQALRRDEQEYWQMRLMSDKSVHQVLNPRLDNEQVNRLSAQLMALLSGDVEAMEVLSEAGDIVASSGEHHAEASFQGISGPSEQTDKVGE